MKGCLSRVEAALQPTHVTLRALPALCTVQWESLSCGLSWQEMQRTVSASGLSGCRPYLRPTQ